MRTGIPQGSVLGSIVYPLCTWDKQLPEDATGATFANNAAILAVGKNNLSY